MGKFKNLLWVGGFLVGIPIILVFTGVLHYFNEHYGYKSAVDTIPNIQVVDTIYVEMENKIIEKIKHDTIYIKIPCSQPKKETFKDTL